MAYIVNVTETPPNVAATYQVALGAHVTDDLLLICLSQDGGGTAITAPGGWTMIGTQAASQACRQAWAYKVATSGAEANPTFSGSNDDWIGTCFVIRDADPTTPINGWQRSEDVYKLALYLSMEGDVGEYSPEGEIQGAGYESGGQVLLGYRAGLDGEEVVLGFNDAMWMGVDVRARYGVVYNEGNGKALATLDFGRVIGVEGGIFEVRFPEKELLRLSVTQGGA